MLLKCDYPNGGCDWLTPKHAQHCRDKPQKGVLILIDNSQLSTWIDTFLRKETDYSGQAWASPEYTRYRKWLYMYVYNYMCYSYSTEPGIYGSKLTWVRGRSPRTRSVYVAISPWQPSCNYYISHLISQQSHTHHSSKNRSDLATIVLNRTVAQNNMMDGLSEPWLWLSQPVLQFSASRRQPGSLEKQIQK